MKKIKVTELDYARIKKAIIMARERYHADVTNLDNLAFEINRAEKINSEKIPPKVVTMNSEVRLLNEDTKKEILVKLVYPNEANFKKGLVSILSPLGTALLGYEVGDQVLFEAPKGQVTMTIKEITYQPESQGEYLT